MAFAVRLPKNALDNPERLFYYCRHAPVAQLDRVSPSEGKGYSGYILNYYL
jgi:hypothetical protein